MKITITPVTLAQAASLAGLYPRLSLATAFEAWQTRKAVRQSFTARSKKEALLRDFEGDKTALDLARDGFYDEYYDPTSCAIRMSRCPSLAGEVRIRVASTAFMMISGRQQRLNGLATGHRPPRDV